jgi:hypothetical protein
MADELEPQIAVEETKVENLDVHGLLVDPANLDEFDEVDGTLVYVPGDTDWVDPDESGDPLAGPILDFNGLDGSLLPTTSIQTSTITKTRRVLADGTVVYDIRFDVTDIGADSYEVAYVKR